MAAMHDYLAKAQENFASADSELQHGRTNSCARSAYYACFHAAIAALLHAGLTAPESARGWGHDWVHASFVGQLIQRCKLYPASLRRILPDLLALRHKGDYRATRVSQREGPADLRRRSRAKRSRRCVVRRSWCRLSRPTSKGRKDLYEC